MYFTTIYEPPMVGKKLHVQSFYNLPHLQMSLILVLFEKFIFQMPSGLVDKIKTTGLYERISIKFQFSCPCSVCLIFPFI